MESHFIDGKVPLGLLLLAKHLFFAPSAAGRSPPFSTSCLLDFSLLVRTGLRFSSFWFPPSHPSTLPQGDPAASPGFPPSGFTSGSTAWPFGFRALGLRAGTAFDGGDSALSPAGSASRSLLRSSGEMPSPSPGSWPFAASAAFLGKAWLLSLTLWRHLSLGLGFCFCFPLGSGHLRRSLPVCAFLSFSRSPL